MLKMIGETSRDPKMLELSHDIKKMMQTRSYDDLMGPKAAYPTNMDINLLRVIDLPD
eukprot:CAMPEP_0116872944 /NCGR_PEP_ID=MMETSP0463-20121206/3891_1 /TAXON_ID=181622 /ORGANISM="Strombidinopsis sp, Strain SopsisLIS2011" /LENGTH=56 /DNA_ID=CAMNT_0004514065 /DNA_START=213 /DNA_END=383 /DNA_ORIENTATION=-